MTTLVCNKQNYHLDFSKGIVWHGEKFDLQSPKKNWKIKKERRRYSTGLTETCNYDTFNAKTSTKALFGMFSLT